jgi:hypothetical protein
VASPNTSQLSQYQYDPSSRRYRNRSNGQYLSAKEVRSAVDTIIDIETLKMRDLAQSLVDGKIALSDWQVQSASLIKSLHVAMGLAANGGLENTSNSALGFLGSLVKKQYAFLKQFALQIRNGTQALDGTLVSRSALYTQASRGTYEAVVTQSAVDGGMTEARSVLGLADHCGDCVEQASLGWQDINDVVPIGDRKCGANCHCGLEFRGSTQE